MLRLSRINCTLWGLLLLPFGLATLGCDPPPEIRHYSLPKQVARDEALPAAAQPKEAGPRGSAAAQPPEGTVPESWRPDTLDSFAVAAYAVREGEQQARITVTPLPLAGGDLVKNVNRWRNKLALAPLEAEQVEQAAQKIEIGGVPGRYVALASAEDPPVQRLVGAIVVHEGTAWVFKLSGDAKVVESQQAGFLDYLKGLHFGSASATAAAAPPQAPPISPRVKENNETGTPMFSPPADWKSETLAPFSVATWKVVVEEAGATITVTPLSGGGADPVSNINRWRDQMKLPPLEKEALLEIISKVDIGGNQGLLVAFDEADGKGTQAMLGALTIVGRQAWIFKMKGDAEVVHQRRAEFEKFLSECRFGKQE